MQRRGLLPALLLVASAVACAAGPRELAVANIDKDGPACRVLVPEAARNCTPQGCNMAAPKGSWSSNFGHNDRFACCHFPFVDGGRQIAQC